MNELELNEPKLKPCPFCGKKATVYVNDGIQIVCTSPHCGARTPNLTDKEFDPKESRALWLAVNIWNTRVSEDNKSEV